MAAASNSMPKVPGYDFAALTQPKTYAKSHGLGFVGGLPAVKPVLNSPTDPNATTGGSPSEQAILKRYPDWKTLDNKVLRFYGYFTERVPESPVETLRVRRVTVLYYLADNTVAVNENAVAGGNSGMRSGCIMSRHADSSVSVRSLGLGEFLTLRGRDVTLVDCDPFTREFFAKMGLALGETGEYPPDTFAAAQASKQRTVIRDEDHRSLKQSMEMAAALASGHASSTMTREERERTERFLKHDREVLSFFATWNKRLFRVSYFIADGTMAVNFLKAPNDGRDPVAAFVKRGKIPKGKFALKSLDTISAPRDIKGDYFTDADLGTGITINLFGRDLYLFDCDPYTREYYRSTHGRELATFDKGQTEGDGNPAQFSQRAVEYPPYNGYGTEEDSLGSVKHMVPKPPKKDLAKYMRHAQDVLRYSAEIDNPAPEDEGRKFIVCYYLADDTVSVFEYAMRNSGHTGGKVFARAKVPGVVPENMQPGSVVRLFGACYKLIEADERTERFLETGASMGGGPDSNAEELLARVRICLTQKFLRLTDAYRHFSAGSNGIGFAELRRMFRECEVKVESDELLARVMHIADADGDGVISLQEFVENVMRQALTHAPKAADVAPQSATYLEDQRRRAKQQFADQVLKMFVTKLEARRAYILDAFRIVSDRSVDGLIGADTFRQVVNDRLGLHLSPEELDALVYRFYYVEGMPDYEKRRLTLRDFRKVLDM
jgi:Ca2+-binding EF-hand superfamily protein